MPRHTLALARLFPLGLLAACAASSDDSSKAQTDKAQIEKEQMERRAESERQLQQQKSSIDSFEESLIEIDKMMNDYVSARWAAGNERAESQAMALETAIRDRALRHLDALLRAAVDADLPDRRATALAALGFSQRPEALDPLLNGLRDTHPRVVSGAVLGLGALRDPRTPPGALAEVVTRAGLETERRRAAASELVRIQDKVLDKEPFVQIWSDLLSKPQKEVDSGIAVQALTGLGLLRKPELYEKAAPFVTNPEPLVRMSAAIALGRLGNQKAAGPLLTLLGPAEQNPNVRLAARKALQALAGNVDYGYDLAAWRKAFERS